MRRSVETVRDFLTRVVPPVLGLAVAVPAAAQDGVERARALLAEERLGPAVEELRRAVERGELTGDSASSLVFFHGYDGLYRQGRQEEAYDFLEAARALADSPVRRGQAAFFLGFVDYQRGVALQDRASPTLDGARASLPVLRRALAFVEESAPWIATQGARVESNHRQLRGALVRLIEVQEIIIERGEPPADPR